MGFILLLFIVTPILEIAVFIQVGGLIGLWPTLGLVVATAVVGTTLLRRQGLATISNARDSLARGEFPVNEVFDGACLLAAGLLLLTPGFVTDFLGALLLTPIFRAAIRGRVIRALMSRTTVWSNGAGPGQGSAPTDDSAIDAEFHVITPADQPDDKQGGSEDPPSEGHEPPDGRG